jgi:hypothetical protein
MKAEVVPLWKERQRVRRSSALADELWTRWPKPEDWPGRLDLYEAAAYLRVNHKTVRRACLAGRDGRAALRHQRIGAQYRIAKRDLDTLGLVQGRAVA